MRRICVCACLLASLTGTGLALGAEEKRNLSVSAATKAATEKRVALVIGNADYQAKPLRNPVNDAQDVADKLKTLGFEVVYRSNLTTRQIGRTLAEFRAKLSPGAVALVFYAGHGLQIRGENYLPTVDADIESEDDVPNQSLSTRQFLDVLADAKTQLNLVFLDACRDNPFARTVRSGGGGGGLAKVDAPSGTLISFATRPGSVAADGTGRNGLYTQELLKAMELTGQPIELALKQVVGGVKRESGGRQEPWMEGSLEGDFFFRPAVATEVASMVVPVGVPSLPGVPVPSLLPVPSAPTGGGLSLDDIHKQQETRAQWDKWQAQMQADFDKVAALDAAPDLKIAAWDRFLAAYTQKNPLADTDEQLRNDARTRKANTEAQRQRQLETRAQWDKWQAQMQADFDKAAALDGAPDLKVAAWDRFLADYTQKNPLGDRDEQLRSEARKAKAEAEKQRRNHVPQLSRASSFQFRVTDRLTGKSKLVDFRVDWADDKQVVFNQGSRIENARGEVQQLSTPIAGEADYAMPPGGWVRPGTLPGTKWSLNYKNKFSDYDIGMDLQAQAREESELDVGGRKLRVLRVEFSGYTARSVAGAPSGPGRGRYQATAWYAPELAKVVRFEVQTRGGAAVSSYFIDELMELVAWK